MKVKRIIAFLLGAVLLTGDLQVYAEAEESTYAAESDESTYVAESDEI